MQEREVNFECCRHNDENTSSSLKEVPVLSIILPVYNTEKYLAQCLDSILSQQYVKFEVLCVDDGSKDRSGEILDEYVSRDSRVRVFHIENQGVSHARNYALERARGSYIGFVDSDDWIDSDHFSSLMECFDDPSVDWAVGLQRTETMDAGYENVETIVCPRQFDKRILSRKEAIEALAFDDLFSVGCYPKIFKKEKIKDLFNEKLTLAEDALFCYQYAVGIEKTAYISCEAYHYRAPNTPAFWVLKNPSRISGLRAYILIWGILSQDDEFSKCRDKVINTLLNWYFVLITYYGQERNTKALSMLNEYKPEIQKYLFLYWSSRHYSLSAKLRNSFKVCFPRFWKLLRCLFNKE